MIKLQTMVKTLTIRSTKEYSLYQGFNATAKLFSVIKRSQITHDEMQYTETWLNEMQKEELMKLSDEDFNKSCSQLNFK